MQVPEDWSESSEVEGWEEILLNGLTRIGLALASALTILPHFTSTRVTKLLSSFDTPQYLQGTPVGRCDGMPQDSPGLPNEDIITERERERTETNQEPRRRGQQAAGVDVPMRPKPLKSHQWMPPSQNPKQKKDPQSSCREDLVALATGALLVPENSTSGD